MIDEHKCIIGIVILW